MSDFLTRWEREVRRTGTLGDSSRVLLLVLLSANMDARGVFSVKREVLAEQIGRSSRRVDERLEQAVAAGYLVRMRRGQKGVTSVYRASLPGVQHDGSQRAEAPSARRNTARRTPAESPFSTTHGGRASSSAVALSEGKVKKLEVGPATTTAKP